MRGRLVALGLSAVTLGGAGLAVAARGGGAGAETAGAADERSVSTVAVARRDLVSRMDVDGTLAYSGDLRVAGHQQGIVTGVPKAGTVVERGQPLYWVENRPVLLLYGDLPAWRRLAAGMADGPDVRQLEANLVALGHATEAEVGVDEKFTAATAMALKRWQKAAGVEETGVIEPGQVVFQPGAFRVAEVKAEKGSAAPPGQAVLIGTSTSRVVTVDLDASKQTLVKAGDKVEVRLPDGRVTAGTIATVGSVAQAKGQGDSARRVVAVTVTLDDPVASGSLDQAPVKVSITSDSRKGALTVPVNALLALAEGGYGVRLADGRIVAVKPGLFARGLVEINGEGIAEGVEVEVPAA